MTLIEITIVVGLLGVVIASLLSVLYSAQASLDRQISRSSSNDQIRLAVEEIDREVRSGNVLYDPATEVYASGDVAAGMSMRVYTESNAPTRGGWKCVQWRITSAGQLQQRSWDPSWQTSPSTLVSGWRIVATNLTNRTDNVAAFSRSSPTAVNIVNINLRANDDATGSKGSTVNVQDSVTGRNQLFFPPSTHAECGPTTPDPTLPGVGAFEPVPPY
jgi:type II secretory pathway pseudopilin PulG